MKDDRYNDFIRGYVCAVANILRLEGVVQTPTKETFRAGVGNATIKDLLHMGVDESDLEIIIEHRKELYH